MSSRSVLRLDDGLTRPHWERAERALRELAIDTLAELAEREGHWHSNEALRSEWEGLGVSGDAAWDRLVAESHRTKLARALRRAMDEDGSNLVIVIATSPAAEDERSAAYRMLAAAGLLAVAGYVEAR